MDLAQLEQAGLKVLFESGGNGEAYPHIYGPIPVNLVLHSKQAIMISGELHRL
jgi:uncharacterized protein (DUF952 family)